MPLSTATLQERVKTARLLGGFSQAQLGVLLRQTQRTICRWENGQAKPTPSSAARLARSLQINLRWLLTGEGPMEAPLAEPARPQKGASASSHPVTVNHSRMEIR
jgi:transcriptional regulator with XRE-family HTH domain